jgi:hypothetical protein
VRWLTAFVDRPAGDVASAARFWCAVTGSRLSPPRGERREFATFLPADGDAYLRVQTVAEGFGGTHLDLHVTDVHAAARRAVVLGAQAQPRDGYVSLTSPAGLQWCLEFAYLVRPADMPLRILFRRLDAPPPGGRASGHLDLAATEVGAEVELHETWGAQVLARFPNWTALADPTGKPYCITGRDPATGTLPR